MGTFDPWSHDASLAFRRQGGVVEGTLVVADGWRLVAAEVGHDGKMLALTFEEVSE